MKKFKLKADAEFAAEDKQEAIAGLIAYITVRMFNPKEPADKTLESLLPGSFKGSISLEEIKEEYPLDRSDA